MFGISIGMHDSIRDLIQAILAPVSNFILSCQIQRNLFSFTHIVRQHKLLRIFY